MTRRTLSLLAAAAALPLALAAAADGVPAWQAKLDAFEKTGAAERKRLGLDRPAAKASLYESYPTPEVTFGEPAVVRPGATAAVKLPGRVPDGSLVVARRDDVEVVSGKRTAAGWEGTVRALPGATPGPVPFVVVTPVSTAEAYGQGLFVGGRHTFSVEAGGDTLVLSAELSPRNDLPAEGEWRRAAKVLGKVAYRLDVSQGSIDLRQDQSPEEMQAQVGGFTGMMESKTWKDLDARTNVEMKKLEACGKLPPEKMGPCFAGPQKELEKLNAERQVLVAKAELEGAPAFGCRNLRLSLSAGKIEGQAEQCAGKRPNDRVQLTGKYTAP